MDKKTISQYGWMIVISLILAVMLAFATPLGTYIGDGVVSIAQGFVGTQNESLDEENVQNKIDEYEGLLNDCPHTNTTITLKKDATCEKDGYTGDKVCKDCHKTIEEGRVIEKGVHSWGAVTVIKEATCKSTGIKQQVCSICKESTETSIDKLEHSNFYTKSGKPVTCTMDGETDTVYCGLCNSKVSVGQQVLATGHKEVLVGSEGAHSKCSVCNTVLSTTHKYEKLTLVTPTCSVRGKWRFSCECGYSYDKEDTKQPSHTYVDLPAVEATCTTSGLTAGRYCSTCNEVFAEQTATPMTGHKLKDVKLNTDYVSHHQCEKCNVKIMPKNSIYYVNTKYKETISYDSAEKIIVGDGKTTQFPSQVGSNDVYVYGDYEYYYGYGYCDDYCWSNLCGCNYTADGWGVRCINDGTQPSDFLNSINGRPVTLATYTYANCYNMRVAPTLPDGIVNAYGMFVDCSNLISYKGSVDGEGNFISYYIPSTVTNVSYMFGYCDSIQIAPMFPDSVIYMDYTFCDCRSFIEIDYIPKNVESMQYAFVNTNLTVAPNLMNCNNLTNIDGTFCDCSYLLCLPELPQNIESMYETFAGCVSVCDDYLGNGNYIYGYTIPSKVTSLNQTFRDCDLIYAFSLNTTNVTDMQRTFYDCDNLYSINVPTTTKNIDEICYDCDSLEYVYLYNTNIETMTRAFYNCDSLFEFSMYNDEEHPGKLTNMNSAFYDCNALGGVYFNNMNSIVNMDYAFYNCNYLHTFSGRIPSTVKNMSHTFAYTNLNFEDNLIPEPSVYIDANPTTYTNCFLGAQSMAYISGDSTMLETLAATDQYIDLSNNDKIRVAVKNPIPYGATYIVGNGTREKTDDIILYGDNLSVSFPDAPQQFDIFEYDDYRYTYKSHYNEYADAIPAGEEDYYRENIDGKYYVLGEDTYNVCTHNPKTENCCGWGTEYFWCMHGIYSSSTKIQTTALSEINGVVVNNARGAFKGFHNLTESPTIPESIKCMQDTFMECLSLTKVTNIPSNLIGLTGTFKNCISLTEVPTLPETVKDMHQSFAYCSSLINAPDIPANVSMSTQTFIGCYVLTGEIKIDIAKLEGTCFWPAGGSLLEMFYDTYEPIYIYGDSPFLETIANEAPSGNVFVVQKNGTIPTGGTYYVGVTGTAHGDFSGATATYTAGQSFPTPRQCDVFVYNGYEYRYGQYYSGDSQGWKAGTMEWSVKILENSDNTYKTSFVDKPVMKIIAGKEIQDMHYCYLRMSNLEDGRVYIPSGVKYLNGTFEWCESLSTTYGIKIPDGAVNTNSMFWNCYTLVDASSLKLPETISSAEGMFYSCYALTKIPEMPSSLLSTTKMFTNCHSLTGDIIFTSPIIKDCELMFSGVTMPIRLGGSTPYMELQKMADTDGYNDFGVNDLVQVKTEHIIETPSHTSYDNNQNYVVLGTWNFKNAESVDIEIIYQTESTSYDWVSITEGNDYISGISNSSSRKYLTTSGSIINTYSTNSSIKFGGTTKTTKKFENVNMKSGSIIFRTDYSVNGYYGVYVRVTPHYKVTLETEHPYSNNMNYQVLGTWNFGNAKSVDIKLTHATESTTYDWLSITEGTDYVAGSSYNTTRNYLTTSGTLLSTTGTDSSVKFGGTTTSYTTNNFYDLTSFLSGSAIFKSDVSVTHNGAFVEIISNY